MADNLTIGRLLVNNAIPERLRDVERVFNKDGSSDFFRTLATDHPEEYIEVLHKLNGIARIAGTEYGGIASVRLQDLRLPPRIKEYRKEVRAKVAAIAQDPTMPRNEKNEKIVAYMRKVMPTIQKNLNEELKGRDNSFALGLEQGFRGNPVQIAQLMFGDMLVADHKGRAIPIPGLHGYGEGVTPSEYWAGSYGARKGYYDTQFATAKTGFLGKQLSLMAQRLKVTGEDCGADDVGIPVSGDDTEMLGSVLSRDVEGVAKGTVLEKKHLPALQGKQLLVRSVSTCQQDPGICQKCAGQRDQGKFPAVGAYVGISSARTISEPLTQLGLKSKHVGGVVGLNDQTVSGFDEINQFLQIPKNFKGGAILAPMHGKIRAISKAPQGGQYMHVGDQQLYVPEGIDIQVTKGQDVEAGDVLTSGTPNPAEIAMHKGLGEGRAYFINKFYDILKDNGVKTHRRHVDILARSFFDKVQITRPEGIMGHTMGDIVSYSELQKGYQPRKGFQDRAPGRSVGWYLERPVLHYTIGTKVTPKVANYLKDNQVSNLQVHREDPGFEPEVIRLMGVSGADSDWKTQLAGFNLKKNFIKSVRTGAESKTDNTSYVPSLLDPTRL
jgi:hypothetical protein